jgi:hypothetical protein
MKKEILEKAPAKKRMQRKAQVEISFHWVFVIIAGAAILIFFLILTARERQSSTAEISQVVGTRLESLLATIQQNPDSVQTQDSLSVELDFHCEADGHTYSLKGGTQRIPLDTEVIFSPSTVGGSKTITWTKLYAAPYPVTQVLYLSDEKTQYVFIDDASHTMKGYYDALPGNFEKRLVSMEDFASFTDEGFRQYIIATSDSAGVLSRLPKTVRGKSRIVDVKVNAGIITFIDPDGSANPPPAGKPYYTDQALFGAVISGDEKLYGCAMEKLMHTSRIVGEVNLARADALNATVAADPSGTKCQYFFFAELPQEYLESIISNSTYLAAGSSGSYAGLENAVDSLANMNREMARANCPTIY